MSLPISVIICTHQPRTAFLQRVLAALAEQTFPADRWELIVVDNASAAPVAQRAEFTWPANGRIVIEERLGLANARQRGIAEAAGGVLVFVDDDNVLERHYLQEAWSIGEAWPILGTWGGQAEPEFEEPPEEWTREYWNWIGIRRFDQALWSNLPQSTATAPFGAGMCVRRRVAEAYAAKLAEDPVRRSLGRTGTQLFGSEDSDLAFTSCDLGLGNGIFPQLILTHLMPRQRLQEEYLLRLVEAQTYSHTMLDFARGQVPQRSSRSQRLLGLYESFFLPPRTRRFVHARRRGHEAAVRAAAKLAIA